MEKIPKEWIARAAYNIDTERRLNEDKIQLLELELYSKSLTSYLMFLLGSLVPSTAILIAHPVRMMIVICLVQLTAIIFLGFKAYKQDRLIYKTSIKHQKKWLQEALERNIPLK